MECTWKRIVSREKGAVIVLATEPAIPPHKSCRAASEVLDSMAAEIDAVVEGGAAADEEEGVGYSSVSNLSCLWSSFIKYACFVVPFWYASQ
jgi:hypothetical protein